MKIRTDFVTNSSSSSFIVCFDKVPTNVDEVKEIFFPDNVGISYWDKYVSAEDLSEYLLKEMKDGPMSAERLYEELKYSEDNVPVDYEYDDPAAFELAKTVFLTEYIKNNFKNLEKVFYFNFEDDYTLSAIWEQYGIIEASGLKYIYENNH